MLDEEQFESLAAKNRCQNALDFTTADGRRLIWHTTSKFLEGQRASALELLHSVPLQKNFSEGAGLLASAIQKVAIVQVKGTAMNVQERIKQLNALSDELVRKTWDAHKNKTIPTLNPDDADLGFASTLASDDSFSIYASITQHLANSTTVAEKVSTLLALIQKTENLVLQEYLFRMLSDELNLMTFWADMFTDIPSSNDRAWILINLVDQTPLDTKNPVLKSLSDVQPKDSNFECRRVLMEILYDYLRGVKMLHGQELSEEITAFHRIYQHVADASRPHYGDTMTLMVDRRLKRLIDYDGLQFYLRELPTELHRIDLIFKIYPMVSSAKDRDTLGVIVKNNAERLNAKDSLRILATLHKDIVGIVTSIVTQLPEMPMTTDTKGLLRDKIKQMSAV